MLHVAWSACLCVCLCVGEMTVLCKDGQADGDAIFETDSCWSKELSIRLRSGLDESICSHRGDKLAMRPFARLLWPVVRVVRVLRAGCNKWTIQDMWRMVWQECSGRIVMVTNLVEKGKVSVITYLHILLCHSVLHCSQRFYS